MKYTNYIRQMSERLLILLLSVTEMLFVQNTFLSLRKTHVFVQVKLFWTIEYVFLREFSVSSSVVWGFKLQIPAYCGQISSIYRNYSLCLCANFCERVPESDWCRK